MKGITIWDSFGYNQKIEFAKAIQIGNDELYIAFRLYILSIPINNPENRIDKIINIIKRKDSKVEYGAVDYTIEPIAYIIKRKRDEKRFKCCIFPIDDSHKGDLKTNKTDIMNQFLKEQKLIRTPRKQKK